MKIITYYCDLCNADAGAAPAGYLKFFANRIEFDEELCPVCAAKLEKALKSRNFWEVVGGA